MTTFEPRERRQHTDLGECQLELDDLREAFDSRPVIDQAKGMLVAARGCTPEEAFRILSEASQRENRKVRDIAQAMVDGARRDRPG
jgi:AmiR/NasT family two-component response regulator